MYKYKTQKTTHNIEKQSFEIFMNYQTRIRIIIN